MAPRLDTNKTEIPEFVVDPKTKKRYKKGRFLGRGGFARCVELVDTATNEIYAGKVVAKCQLVKSEQKEKMSQEIQIHRSVKHKHVVDFHTYFEDTEHIYILLEICNKRSLMEMHKRRKHLTEEEVRYFTRQIAAACQYLHEAKVVHRDLKLGNIFLSDTMEIKVGDFGLATKIGQPGERKLTLCGTPNYIAPEVLLKKGHSYEVDVWSLGCIVFTLIVGKPPFETNDLKDTYKRIRHNDYHIPPMVSSEAKKFIQSLLKANPSERPSMLQILNDPYMTKNYIPSGLPTSCLTMAPRFNCNGRLSIMPTADVTAVASPRKPLSDMNKKPQAEAEVVQVSKPVGPNEGSGMKDDVPKDFYLKQLCDQLKHIVNCKPAEKSQVMEDEAEDPRSAPLFFISKWVDYTDKYGIGYQLSDNSIGVLFNDVTRILLFADGQNLQFIERDLSEKFYTLDKYPQEVYKKVTLLKYFRNYMNEHLLKTGEEIKPRDCDDLIRLPHLNNWFRTRNAIVFHLTNGTVQVNFFLDHVKLILCPLMGAVTYIDEKRDFRTFKLSLIEKFGCSKDIAVRLRYARDCVQRLQSHKVTSSHKSTTKK